MRLAGWSGAQRARTTEQALELLRAIPGGPRIQVPIRYASAGEAGDTPIRRDFDNAAINRLIDAAPMRRVDVRAMVTGQQHTVSRSRVESYIRKPQLVPVGSHHRRHGGPIDFPIVCRYLGECWLYDGHHRVTAAVLLGERWVWCRYVDLDAERTGGN